MSSKSPASSVQTAGSAKPSRWSISSITKPANSWFGKTSTADPPPRTSIPIPPRPKQASHHPESKGKNRVVATPPGVETLDTNGSDAKTPDPKVAVSLGRCMYCPTRDGAASTNRDGPQQHFDWSTTVPKRPGSHDGTSKEDAMCEDCLTQRTATLADAADPQEGPSNWRKRLAPVSPKPLSSTSENTQTAHTSRASQQ
jgi:hypothetical protein